MTIVTTTKSHKIISLRSARALALGPAGASIACLPLHPARRPSTANKPPRKPIEGTGLRPAAPASPYKLLLDIRPHRSLRRLRLVWRAERLDVRHQLPDLLLGNLRS